MLLGKMFEHMKKKKGWFANSNYFLILIFNIFSLNIHRIFEITFKHHSNVVIIKDNIYFKVHVIIYIWYIDLNKSITIINGNYLD